MTDRVEALDGTVTFASSPGTGTVGRRRDPHPRTGGELDV